MKTVCKLLSILTLSLLFSSYTSDDDCKKEHALIKRNEALIRRYFDEVLNKGNLSILDELVAPDYINNSPNTPNPLPGPAGLKPIIIGLRTAFPDLHFEILNMCASETQVAIHCVMTGTQTGDYFGTPATGKTVKVNQMQFERIDKEGKMCEHWRQSDDLGRLEQLGLLKPDCILK